MRKIKVIFLIAALLIALIVSGCSNSVNNVTLKSQDIENTDSSWDVIKDDGILKVGISPKTLPYVEKTSGGEYTGFLIDMMDEICSRAGIEAEYIEVVNGKAASMLSDNLIDVILSGYTQVDFGNKNIKWLEPYMTNNHIIVCNPDSDINTKEDLAGKKTGVTEDTVSDITAQSDIKIDNNMLIKYETEKKAIGALDNGETDALIIEDAYFYYYTRSHTAKYKILNEIVSAHIHSLGIKKENLTLSEKLNEIIAEMKKDKTLEKLSVKWFNTSLIK